MLVRLFRAHGEFCASHPWEVIVATLTLTACMLSMDKLPTTPTPLDPRPPCPPGGTCLTIEDYNAVDVIVMTTIRCISVLYSYYQFCILQKLGSKYILGIAGLFTVFSSFVFSSTVINLMQSDISDLKDALFFFLLLIDLSKATLLAQFALSSCSQQEVKSNIARGMALLGPTITLDNIVETLVISVGTLSGVKRLEVLCCFACMSVVVNYVVFMTFYPAVLSLILELSTTPSWHNKSLIMKALREEDQKPNPVVQRVKVIMSAGLVVVHAHSRWALRGSDEESTVLPLVADNVNSNGTEGAILQEYFMRWVTGSADHIVILILLLALTVKFIFFEDKEELAEQILMASASGPIPEHNHARSVDASLRYKFSQLLTSVDGEGDWTELGCSLVKKDVKDKGVQTMTDLHSPATEVEVIDKPVQTDSSNPQDVVVYDKGMQTGEVLVEEQARPRPLDQCLAIYKEKGSAEGLTDLEVQSLIPYPINTYKLEEAVNNLERGVRIRRQIVGESTLKDIPYCNYDYSKVWRACCENVIGVVPVPVGVVGPLLMDGRKVRVPLATTEGCLVASANRGARVLQQCGGVRSVVVADGMTRAPLVRFPSVTRASEAMLWMQSSSNFELMRDSFNSTSRFARLIKLHVRIAGRKLFIRFVATTGDAMGMNMLSKGTEVCLKMVQKHFPDMELLSLSGNYCSDKKPAAVNWIEGRGKYVVCEAIVPGDIVTEVFKISVSELVNVNNCKNLIGSAIAGSVGGNNAHAANIVTAIFIATGQDPAQSVTSSNCMTLMEPWGKGGRDLHISCTMPSLEVGTVGGGTHLPAQAACLDLLGIRGPNLDCPGENAKTLARIVCGTVLAAELSLIAALTKGHLVASHLKHNRSSTSNSQDVPSNCQEVASSMCSSS